MATACLIAAALNAQPPQGFKYQAVIRDGSGNLITNQTVSIRISIHDVSPSGTVVYQETFMPTTSPLGLINLEIGKGTPAIGSFMDIIWRQDPKYLELECDPAGGNQYISMGTSELMSVPYSFFSGSSSDSFWQSMVSNKICYNSGQVGVGTNDPQELIEIYGNNAPGGLRVSWGDAYPGLYGDFRHEMGGGLQINAQTGSGTGGWADIHFQTNGTTKMFLESAGNVGIGTTTPSNLLELASSAPKLYFNRESATSNLSGLYWRSANDSYEGAFVRNNADGSFELYSDISGSDPRLLITNEGYVGIGTTDPNEVLHVNDCIRVGDDPSYSTVYGELIHEGGGTGFRINANAGGGGWGDLHLQTNGNTRMFIESAGNVGIGTTSPACRLDVQGNVIIRDQSTGDIALELGKGLDYAEGFFVSDETAIEPGTVLCIDPANPDRLKISDKPYDNAVAGIVAGAHGLGSGVRLGSKGFDCDVALAGRVYCNTIAIHDDIRPGDLLTTSPVPGYAMEADHPEKAHGAILGKAMQSLRKGEKGQILVLVSLQ